MEPTDRPTLADFTPHLDTPFTVSDADGTPVGEWKLLACSPLKKADIPELEGKDCFSLLFEAPAVTQGIYQLIAVDGTRHVLGSTPVGPDRMEIVVN